MAYETTSSSQIVTALFDSRSDAQAAVDRLTAEGLSSSDIRLVEGSTSTATSSTTGTATTSTEHKGFWESLGDFFMPDEDRYTYAEGLSRGGYLVSVTTTASNRDSVLDILDDEGTVNIDEREESWRSEGWSGYEAGTSGYDRTVDTTTTSSFATSGSTSSFAPTARAAETSTSRDYAATSRVADADRAGTIDVVEEQLRVGKRDVSHGRVRVRSYVVEEPVSEQVSLRQERVDIERRPVDRAVSGNENLFRDQTIELEESAEEAVVSKTARVTEEIDLRKVATDRVETVSDSVRRTEVEIEDERREGTIERERGLTGTTGRVDRDL